MAKKNLKTVEEHNYERLRAYEDRMNSGIECPKCEALGREVEMKFVNNFITMGHPPKREVKCPSCNHSEFVLQ